MIDLAFRRRHFLSLISGILTAIGPFMLALSTAGTVLAHGSNEDPPLPNLYLPVPGTR